MSTYDKRGKLKEVQAPSRFISLHSHTGFSALDGLDPPEAHIDFIRSNGMDGWCLTEHGHMNSFAQAYLHVEKLNKAGAGFKLVGGCEMYLHPDLEQWKLHRELRAALKEDTPEGSDRAKLIEEQLAQFRNPVVARLDEDDDIEDLRLASQDDDGSDSTITVEDEESSKGVDRSRFSDPIRRRHHLVVLPRNSRGLEKLFGLVSRGYREGFFRFPRVDYRMIKEVSEGDLIASTACLAGPVSYSVFESLQSGDVHALTPDLLDNPILHSKIMRNIGNTWDQLVWAFGEEFAFMELQFNRLPAQHLVNRAILEFANNNGLLDRLVVTADSHYPSPERWRDREVYKGLGYGSWKDLGPDAIPLKPEDLKCELYPKNSAQLWEEVKADAEVYPFYENWGEVVASAINRAHDVVHDLIEDVTPDRSVKLPTGIIPKDKTPLEVLIARVKEGMEQRGVASDDQYIERVKYELGVIAQKGTELYFLTEQKIMLIGRENMLVGPGRGSAAGSLVCYLLGITDVDPIEWGLSFERFLSPTRTDMPDVDSDFEDRDAMIGLLQAEFGEENVIPISSYGRMQISTGTKDIAKVLGIPFDEVNAATRGLDMKVKSAVAGKGEAKAGVDVTFDLAVEHHKPFADLMEKYPDLAGMVGSLGKQIKSIGRHAGGVLISEDVPNRMPVIMSKGRLQTPWIEGMAAKQLEPFGWIKFDVLGLETLSIIRRCVEMIIQRERGLKNPKFHHVSKWVEENLDPKVIDFNDKKVYDHVYRDGRWFGIFQCTNGGAQKFFQRAKPQSLIEIATLTSIFRPGPLGGQVDQMYVERKNDPSLIPEMHPMIWKVLEPTYGLLIFQEQVMDLAHYVAGIPRDKCDDLRRGITKSSYKHLVPELKEQFISGALESGLPETEAEQLWENMINFAAYGFNKSHAVSYAMVSYWCAWLLTYYEDEWICAWCESMSGNADDRATAFRTVRKWGGGVKGIDARVAEENWRIVAPNTYMPSLASAKGVGKTALRELKKFRPFDSMEDLLFDDDGKYRLSKLNKKALEALIRIGAFDCFVGEGKEFVNTNHMIQVVIDNNDKLKKSLKKDPQKGLNTYRELCLDGKVSPPVSRDRGELIRDQQEILGMVDPELLVSPKVQSFFVEHGIVSMDEILQDGAGVAWFTISDAMAKRTKMGKPYLILTVMDSAMGEHKVYCWGWTGERADMPERWSLGVAKLQNDEKFGWKCNWKDTRIINSSSVWGN